jgi:hypothetical protein
MRGTITFPNAEELAKFLLSFTGSTAQFTVFHAGGAYILTFTGAC